MYVFKNVPQGAIPQKERWDCAAVVTRAVSEVVKMGSYNNNNLATSE